MFASEFEQHGLWFGIVVEDWGDPRGATKAAATLRSYVNGLDNLDVEALHNALIESDEAFGDDPIWESGPIAGLHGARMNAHQAGIEVSAEELNEGHHCVCWLAPLSDHP